MIDKKMDLNETSPSKKVIVLEKTKKENKYNNKFHITHYKKVKLNKDISLRYFFAFEDRSNMVNKWVIKSHSTKKYQIVNTEAAKLIAASHNKELSNYKEIIGRYIFKDEKQLYRKIVIKNDKVKITYEEN